MTNSWKPCFKRWLQVLLPVGGLVACTIAISVWKRVDSRCDAIERVRELGGHVWYEFNFHDNGEFDWLGTNQEYPYWMSSTIGADVLYDVVVIDFSELESLPEDLSFLCEIDSVRWIKLGTARLPLDKCRQLEATLPDCVITYPDELQDQDRIRAGFSDTPAFATRVSTFE